MSSCSRPMWAAGTMSLQRQKSCIEPSFSTKTCSARPVLQKQLSVDITNKTMNFNNINKNNNCNAVWSAADGKPEASLRIFTVGKKHSTQLNKQGLSTTSENNEPKKDRLKKQASTTHQDDRININIFLSHGPDDGGASDLDSEKEATKSYLNEEKPMNKDSFIDSISIQPKVIVTADERRAQFQNSKKMSGTTSTVHERRQPLVRAMSAPVRSFDESSKQGKRRVNRRNRKVRSDISEPLFMEIGVETDENTNLNETNRKTTKKLMPPRARSVFQGCDVVTLVSLLSSGGSDSEREDISLSKNEIVSSGRAPMLKKSGKSESEDLAGLSASSRELPTMLRKGSIAPLAARLRAKRPPTAPPGSIYLKNCDNSDISSIMDSKNSNKNDSAINETTCGNSAKTHQSHINDAESPTAEIYPEHCKSKKEKDCWKLYKKMFNKGVSVSYDTILRGMLTPTELRAVQKQKKLDEENQVKLDEENQLVKLDESDNSGGGVGGGGDKK